MVAFPPARTASVLVLPLNPLHLSISYSSPTDLFPDVLRPVAGPICLTTGKRLTSSSKTYHSITFPQFKWLLVSLSALYYPAGYLFELSKPRLPIARQIGPATGRKTLGKDWLGMNTKGRGGGDLDDGSTSTDAVLTGGKETQSIKPMIVLKADDVTITTA